MQQKHNHWVGLGVLLLVMSFFFYKSILSNPSFKETLSTIEHLQNLQVKLHRDILRYRNSQIYQYDFLNETIEQVRIANQALIIPDTNDNYPEIAQAIKQLKTTISHQEDLAEDFKTHHAILQNSLSYYSRMSEEIYASDSTNNSPGVSREILGRLSTLILEYVRSPKHESALKVFPIIDSLNHKPSMEVNALIKHSLIIIERLPEIDLIIKSFNTLNAEQQIVNIKEKMQQASA